MKIEVGKSYKTRNNQIAKIISKTITMSSYLFLGKIEDRDYVWTESGKYYSSGAPSHLDLIEEYKPEPIPRVEHTHNLDMTPVNSGGTKHDQGKPKLSLIPYSALEAEAFAFMVGEKKYGKWNYTKGMEVSRLLDAIGRHLGKFNNGEEFDEDGAPHLGCARAGIAMLIECMYLGTAVDDRRVKPKKP